MDSFFDVNPTPFNEYNATLILTKTVHYTATATEIVMVTATSTAIVTTATPKATPFEIPHFPRVDTAFTAIFTTGCLLLLIGVLLRNKKRKIKGFNIPLFLGSLFNALGHFLHADYSFISKRYEVGRVVRIILTIAPIFYSLALFTLHRKTRNRATVRSATIFSCLAGLQVLYCTIAAFGDGAVLFYTGEKWGEMDVAKHLAVSQVFGQQLILCFMMGMWIRGRNVQQERDRSFSMEELLALVMIPTILGALLIKVCAQFIMIIRNDQCFVVYELLERSAEIHFSSASALSGATLVAIGCQMWMWRLEWRIRKRRKEQDKEQENQQWTPSPPTDHPPDPHGTKLEG